LTTQLKINEARCAGCGQCTLICELDALTAEWGRAVVDHDLCVRCGLCLDFCPLEAISMEEV